MSLHDIVEPLDAKAIRWGKQVKLGPGEVAVVFSPGKHGLVTQAIVANPATKPTPDAQAIAALLTWCVTVPDIRERLSRRLEEIRKA